MADGASTTFASEKNAKIELLDENTYLLDSRSEEIVRVELKFWGYYQLFEPEGETEESEDVENGDALLATTKDVSLTPILGEDRLDTHTFTMAVYPAKEYTADITDDNNAPDQWTWADIKNLNVEVKGSTSTGGIDVFKKVSLVKIIPYYNKDDMATETLTYVENTSTGASFWIDSRITYGDILITSILMLLIIGFIIFGLINLIFAKKVNFKRQ